MLKAKQIPFQEIDLSGDFAAMNALKARSGHATMPQVFLDGALLGGYTELSRYVDSHGEDALK